MINLFSRHSLFSRVKSLMNGVIAKLFHSRKITLYKNSFPRISRNVRLDLARNSKLIIGFNCWIDEFTRISINTDAVFKIGNNVNFNRFTEIGCSVSITMGNNIIIGPGLIIYDFNHTILDSGNIVNVTKSKLVSNPVKIGSNIWIGANVTILMGVVIGDNVIIGAGSVVRQSIPSNAIYSGSSIRESIEPNSVLRK